MKVLVADDKDSLSVGNKLKEIFPGIEIDYAETADIILKKIRENNYSFIVIDVSGKIDPNVITRIKETSNLSVPIISLSRGLSLCWSFLGSLAGADKGIDKDSFLECTDIRMFDKFKGMLRAIGASI